MKQSTLAAGRHVLLETDQEVQDLDGENCKRNFKRLTIRQLSPHTMPQ